MSLTNIQKEAYALEEGFKKVIELLLNCKQQEGTIYIIGNGGSAAIASHAVIDLLNTTDLRAITLHESAAVTCLSNDYGYERVYEKQLNKLVRSNDLLIAISSSGKSLNILNAVYTAKIKNAAVITFSGFSADNPLRKMGNVNIWLNSNDYGMVEIGHAFILHNITDRLNTKRLMDNCELADESQSVSPNKLKDEISV